MICGSKVMLLKDTSTKCWDTMEHTIQVSVFFLQMMIIICQKFNMEPEKKSLEKAIPFGNHHFSGSMLNFGGVCANNLFTRQTRVFFFSLWPHSSLFPAW